MGRIMLATSASTDEEYGGTFATQASEVAYDNSNSVADMINKLKVFDSGTVLTSATKVIDLSSVSLRLMLLIVADTAYVLYVRGSSIVVSALGTSSTYGISVTASGKYLSIVNGNAGDSPYTLIYME